MPEMSGFRYNGVHCEDLGLYYIPTKEDQWFSDPEYDVYGTDIDWRHGGVYYASKAKVRTFTLKCYFEEIDIAKRQAIKEWVRRDSSGTLIFDDMPFVYWIVHPGKIPVGNWYLDNSNSHSGTVTITFNAYEPFGYLNRKANTGSENDGAEDYCHLIDEEDMPAEPTIYDTSFDIYNPGTEACGMSIEIAGSTVNPFRFSNETNGTYCVINSLPTNNLHLDINGETGYVSTHIANSSTFENGFAYHDKGIIRLDPNIGYSNVSYINGAVSGTEYRMDLVNCPVTKSMKGALVMLSDEITLTIDSANPVNNRIYCTAESAITLPETGTCSIRTINKIRIQEKINNSWTVPSTLNLSYIKVDYKPRAM